MFLGVLQVSDEFRVHAFEGDLLWDIGFLDTISVSFTTLVVSGMILTLGHCSIKFSNKFK